MPHDKEKRECVVCQTSLAADDMVRFGEQHVCADCKPRYVQALKEGINPIEHQVCRSGRYVVLKKGTQLPDRCVICNSEAHHREVKVGQVMFHLTRMPEELKITIPLCDHHHRKRRKRMTVGVIMIVAGISSSFLMTVSNIGMVGPVIAIVGGIIGLPWAAPMSLQYLKGEHIWLNGAKAAFLASLPEFSEPEPWWQKKLF